MMLLGIYLHAAVAYSSHGVWPWKDGSTTGVFDASLGLIHVFRMPVFYVMAGFFAALLLEQRGIVEFVRNRAVRVLVPFVGAWAVLFPVVTLLATIGAGLDEPEVIPSRFVAFFTSGELLRQLDPMHLWFLEYLLIFYALALAAMPLARRRPALVGGLDRVFRAVVTSPLGPGVFAIVTFPILCLMQEGTLDDPSGFIPQGGILVAYLVFFAAGWLLYRNADLLPVLCRLPRAPILLGLGLGVAVLGGYSIWHRWQWPADHASLWFLTGALLVSLSMWLFTLGFTGVFLRCLEQPLAWLRYLSDASYWLYLVHMPVLLAVQIAVARTGWTPGLKVVVVLAVSLPTLLASYHVLVRPTWVGAILNGRRRPITRRRAVAAVKFFGA